jgi:hypothetical protein
MRRGYNKQELLVKTVLRYVFGSKERQTTESKSERKRGFDSDTLPTPSALRHDIPFAASHGTPRLPMPSVSSHLG